MNKLSLYIVLCFLMFQENIICRALEIVNTPYTINSSNSTNCTVLKYILAETMSEFTLCSVNYSRPITLCESCINVYINLLDSYNNLSQVSPNGTKCIDLFINLDRLQILETQYSNSVNLWNQAKCYECYLVENGTQTRKKSKATKEFRNYYDNFKNCTKKHKDMDTLCRDCMKNYVTLTNYYESITNVNDKIGICIDLEDLMNGTWTFWSTSCCKYRRHNEYIFIGSTVSVIILTISLYVLVQFCGEKKAPIIIQQSRFVESVNRQ